ncbi:MULTISPECIES: hypothetical protein [Priestia]|uniref:hypothetical protein n=1 Tax=Priestia TaxID=2800373 RepID=UPI001596EB55|nr:MULTISPECIES: hypothetical protein [Priestia]MBX9995597.1 hypothetical protein [Priestia aryabhattai]MED4048887.1 hypothetical protein [Priestia megaterium]MED4058472.1 hypothetical protein [Priestia megaterium]UYT87816.1 hypothetical protein OHU75_09785 [Priestia megaterium]
MSQAHLMRICTGFPVIVFGGYYGQLEDRAVNIANIAEVHSKIVFESKIKEGLVVQGLSLWEWLLYDK